MKKNEVVRVIIIIIFSFFFVDVSAQKKSHFYDLYNQAKNNLQLKPDSTISIGYRALNYASKADEKVKIQTLIGDAYYAINNKRQSINCYKLALKEAVKGKDKVKQAELCEYLGMVNAEAGNLLEAKEFYNRGLDIAVKTKDLNVLTKLELGIGVLNYTYQYRSFDQSVSHLNKALQYSLQLKDTFLIARCYEELASIYLFVNKDEEGKEMLQKARYFYNSIQNIERVSYLHKILGDYFYKYGQDDSSVLHYKIAYDLRITEGNNEGIGISATDLAYMYSLTGNSAKFNAYAQIAIEKSNQTKKFNLTEYVYLWLSEGAANLKQFDLAYKYHLEFFKAYDSTNTLRKSEQIIREGFQDKLEAQKSRNDKQMAVSKERARQQQNIIFIFVGAFSILLLLIVFIWRAYRKNLAQRKIIESQKTEVEFQKGIIEEKHREIIDSMRYARRIQQAQLPSDKYLDKNLNRKNKLS